MSGKRTVGIGVIAVVSVLLGGMIAVGNTVEVLRGTTFDGRAVDVTAGTLGVAGALLALLLLLGGIGTWLVKPYGRKFSLAAAAGFLVVNVFAVILLGLPVSFLVVGGLYPAILLVAFNLSSWKAAFTQSSTEPVAGPAG